MIIWDYNNQEHIIRINGIERARLQTSDFAGTITQIERKVEKRVDGVIVPLGYHFYLHIFIKGPPSNYVIWLGQINSEPTVSVGNQYWWELEELHG